MTLFAASCNPGKLREFRQAALMYGIAVESVPNFASLPACAEDGRSFEENARKKALHYRRFSDGLVFADDSGISLEALGGAPGIYSARFAGEEATDEQNNAKLIAELRRVESEAKAGRVPASDGKPGAGAPVAGPNYNRRAHYICVIALAERGQVLTVAEGRADGEIIDSPRGSGGFGYDPYFFYPPLGRTFAELSPEEKFRVSHRGEAFRKILDYLRQRAGALRQGEGG